MTLVLQWMPNATLERNPRSIQTISPRAAHTQRVRLRTRNRDSSSESEGPPSAAASPLPPPAILADDSDTPLASPPDGEQEIHVRMNGDELTVVATEKPRPISLPPVATLPPPEINVIPQTPGSPPADHSPSADSPPTSGADDDGGSDGLSNPSSPFSSEPPTPVEGGPSALVLHALQSSHFLERSPEEFAGSHNMILPDGTNDALFSRPTSPANAAARPATPGQFSVDLGRMRTLRLFYSDPHAGAGQLVVASHEGRYKILHFHHGGMDKLAAIFQQWSAVRTRSTKGTPVSHYPPLNSEVTEASTEI